MELGVFLDQKLYLKSAATILIKQSTNVPGLGLSNEIQTMHPSSSRGCKTDRYQSWMSKKIPFTARCLCVEECLAVHVYGIFLSLLSTWFDKEIIRLFWEPLRIFPNGIRSEELSRFQFHTVNDILCILLKYQGFIIVLRLMRNLTKVWKTETGPSQGDSKWSRDPS